jgi:alpha-galactosidase/6-phospho-beta-glucosidase family protein
LAASAAASGDRDIARLALLANPLVREYRLAEGMLDRLLADAPARIGTGR